MDEGIGKGINIVQSSQKFAVLSYMLFPNTQSTWYMDVSWKQFCNMNFAAQQSSSQGSHFLLPKQTSDL